MSFENADRMSEEEKIMVKNIIEIAEQNMYKKVNGFKRVNRNSLEDWITKLNANLKDY